MTLNRFGLECIPANQIARMRAILRAARLTLPLWTLVVAMVAALVLAVLHGLSPGYAWLRWWCLGVLSVGAVAAVVVWMRLRDQLLLPLVRLECSLTQVCQGEPGASDSLCETGVLRGIAQDIRSLNEELTDLYEDMDNRVARQTRRLAQKTASLKILYDVAAGIHQTDSVEELLLRFLRVLKEMINGRAATVRLVMSDGSRRLVGSIGLDDDLVREQDMAPVDLCLCGSVLAPGDIVCDNDARYCSRIYGRRMFDSSEMEVVTVPLEHRDQLLGVYSIFVDRPGVKAREDIMDLLFTVGHHLGVAIAKQRSDAEARRLSIVEERNSLAHELHDSLAQTLASLRFQCRMLDDSLGATPISEEARNDLARLRNGLDEAHTELRELLASFRAPLDRRGLVPALAKLTQRFGQETGAHVLFQNDCRPFELSASEDLQLLRIVQESLANIRKHAQAHTVRVLLTRDGGDRYVLLVEDDGVGFSAPADGSNPGERIGLSIMEERARRIGAEMRIESEPGEGTRVEVVFEVNRRGARHALGVA
ncbi:integral membrane sensor signal transduction histidine kinase [Thiorhodococcus drewsii AZ1]|uniref:Sensor protein n=1 Tax=Thiorhodococcus drewsii AZ1 TaxID=765913 RepID=G2E6L8_9GAMM|nr:ATP-binding protein [Thiorhodococcus drewsii]EGV28228.1 integral membrane sensor signal transduction histidine kinase [Thiorhodococcus drewsii AZ1]